MKNSELVGLRFRYVTDIVSHFSRNSKLAAAAYRRPVCEGKFYINSTNAVIH